MLSEVMAADISESSNPKLMSREGTGFFDAFDRVSKNNTEGRLALESVDDPECGGLSSRPIFKSVQELSSWIRLLATIKSELSSRSTMGPELQATLTDETQAVTSSDVDGSELCGQDTLLSSPPSEHGDISATLVLD